MGSSDIARTIDAVYRMEAAKIIATVARITGDVGVAEELAQDALVTALEKWPDDGVPDEPGAWLMTAAKNRAIDHVRARRRRSEKLEEIGRSGDIDRAGAPDESIDDDVGDDVLRLIFVACHPVLSQDARVALTLRLLGGLRTDEIARAFLVPEPTVGQRISRAKRTLEEACVPFEVPREEERKERLESVLEVIYLIFNEGYAATSGEDRVRPALCEEAMRLGRVLAGLAPDEPEVHGLVALMELHASRIPARTTREGEPILLLEQNRAGWDRLLIERGLAALARAEELGGAGGAYALQAAIAACHARARTPDETPWPKIAALYYALSLRTPSPIVELNRAMAVAMAFGPAEGLRILDSLTGDPALRDYHLLPAARGDLLAKLGRTAEARAELERAASLTKNERDREQLLARATQLRDRH